jgi:hypothetical protein
MMLSKEENDKGLRLKIKKSTVKKQEIDVIMFLANAKL